jgi:competence protein ComEC
MKRSRIVLVLSLFLILVATISVLVRYVIVPQLGDLPPGKEKDEPGLEIPGEGVFDPDSIPFLIDPVYKVHFIDVGQGDAILIQAPSKNVLVDGGDSRGGLVEYLLDLAIDTLNLLISTHPHADHIGALPEVLKTFTVLEVIDPGVVHTTALYTRYLQIIDSLNIPFVPGRAGMKREISDHAFIELLHPVEPSDKLLNDASIVLMLVLEQVRVLLTGDIEKRSETEILSHYAQIQSHVLKVAHHGSATSSSDDFLKAVSPQVAVIFCSEDNKYGFPHIQTLNRLSALKAGIMRTDQSGTIVMVSDGDAFYWTTDAEGSFVFPDQITIPGYPVDLNTASVDELTSIIHIGPARAKQLVSLRPIYSLDDLLRIQGIDEKRLNDIKQQNIAFVNQP